jgi:hypothetical protein
MTRQEEFQILNKQERELTKAYYESYYKIKKEIDELVSTIGAELGYSNVYCLGYECEDSPIGECIGDKEDEMGEDSCIFCGGPEERK